MASRLAVSGRLEAIKVSGRLLMVYLCLVLLAGASAGVAIEVSRVLSQ